MAVKQVNVPAPWPVFTDDSIETYVGLEGEPIIDGRGGQRQLRICDGVTPGCNLVGGGGGASAAVATPTIISPANNATVGRHPTFVTSGFNGITADLKPDEPLAAFWQIASDANFTNILLDVRNDSFGVNRQPINAGYFDVGQHGFQFTEGQTYYLRFAYMGKSGIASSWSPTYTYNCDNGMPDTHLATIRGDAIAGGSFVQMYPHFTLSRDGQRIAIQERVNGGVTNEAHVNVHRYENGTWVKEADLRDGAAAQRLAYIPNSNTDNVALSDDGTVMAIGYMAASHGITGQGNVTIYRRTGTTWTYEGFIVAPSPASGRNFGYNVALSADGTTLAVHAARAPDNSARGSLYIYRFNGTSWTLELNHNYPSGSGDWRGFRLNADGTHLYRCQEWGGTAGLGAIMISKKVSGSWQVDAVVVEPPPNFKAYDGFGYSVAINDDETVMAVGSVGNVYTGGYDGAVYIFKKFVDDWLLDTILPPVGIKYPHSPQMGWRVEISGDGSLVAASAPWFHTDDDNWDRQGVIYYYKDVGVAWEFIGMISNPVAPYDPSTYSMLGLEMRMSAAGDRLVVIDDSYEYGELYVLE